MEAVNRAYKGHTNIEENELFYRLRAAFVKKEIFGLYQEMNFCFVNHLLGNEQTLRTKGFSETQKGLANLRYPIEWYPATRALQRTVHLHIGPTNSGKTYHALQRLEAAESGDICRTVEVASS